MNERIEYRLVRELGGRRVITGPTNYREEVERAAARFAARGQSYSFEQRAVIYGDWQPVEPKRR